VSQAGTVTVVGLGPAGPEYLSAKTVGLLESGSAILRTRVHPAAAPFAHLASYDDFYEAADDFESLYRAIVDDLVVRARSGPVVYAVPGSPLIAEHTVELLRADPRVEVLVEPALSFCDLAWAALGIDPIAHAVTVCDLVDLLERRDLSGPLLIAQAWSDHLIAELIVQREWLSRSGPATVTVLHHLGLDDELVCTVPFADLATVVDVDHLTSLYVESWNTPGSAFGELMVLAERLRAECPWDQEQTHASLARHLLEEAYEALDALDALDTAEDPIAAAAHLEEELGDVLFQVCFHAVLGAEDGDFSAADIADAVRTKLISRHPHVFGDVVATTPDAVAANWETLKKAEKGRASVTEGIPQSLPALALMTKLQRKARALGMVQMSIEDALHSLDITLRVIATSDLEAAPTADNEELLGTMLDAICQIAVTCGADLEAALRVAAARERAAIIAFEQRS
jgi:tetrapyrrole methylase family protein / MazG family protein